MPETERTLLIVEDDEPIIDLLTEVFSQTLPSDVKTESIKTLEEAQKQLIDEQSVRPSAVILDLILSDGHGIRLLEDMRQKNIDIPVFVLTADINPTVKQEAENLSASVTTKPLDVRRFSSAVNEVFTQDNHIKQ